MSSRPETLAFAASNMASAVSTFSFSFSIA